MSKKLYRQYKIFLWGTRTCGLLAWLKFRMLQIETIFNGRTSLGNIGMS
jgi:hypothetical protein